ncbi:MAG: hypothetical protein GX684_07335 [Ruminococcaceae bacterium]|nr:hypothetical protein [Oscillospiraceae bacterium]
MKKYALTICGISGSMGAFGIFVRWIQNMTAYEKASGLYISGNFWGRSLFVMCVLTVAGLWGITYFLGQIKGLTSPSSYKEALKKRFVAEKPIIIAIGVIMMLGAALLFAKSDELPFPSMSRIHALLTFLAVIGFWMMTAAADHPVGPKTLCVFSILPILFAAFWLLLSYREDTATSIVWRYAVEILTLSFSLLGYYFISGLAFGKRAPRGIIFFSAAGAYFSIINLADDLPKALLVIFFGNALVLLYFVWSVTSNLCPISSIQSEPELIIDTEEEEEEEPLPAQPAPIEADEDEIADVIEVSVSPETITDEDGDTWQEWDISSNDDSDKT